MILEIPFWVNNINKFLYLISTNNNINKVFLNAFLDNDYIRMGGDPEFLDKCVNLCVSKKIPIILGLLYSEKYNTPKRSFDLPEEVFKKVEWPTYYIHRTFNLMSIHYNLLHNKNLNLDILNNKVNFDSTFEYDFITMNNISKHHRSLLMDILAKYNLMDNGAIVWRNVIRLFDNATDALNFEAFKYKYWKPKIMLLDQEDSYNIKHQEWLPKEYNKSFMHIVTESEDNFFILSEKTAVPLLFNKPFLVVSCSNFHNILQDLGFKLYDELFDYSFDKLTDISDRIEGLVKNIIKIKNMSNEQKSLAFDSIKEKLKYNRQLALSMVFDRIPNEVLEMAPQLENFSYLLNELKDIKNNVY